VYAITDRIWRDERKRPGGIGQRKTCNWRDRGLRRNWLGGIGN
jgi:hypothetical protein